MKKSSNGTYRLKLNDRGFEQRGQDHYEGSTIAAPVTNEATVHIVVILVFMAGWDGHVIDVKGAFLHGEVEEGE